MNAFQLLKQDHQTVSGIFQQLEPTTERAEKTRTELFAKLKVLQENVEHHVEEEEGEMFQKARQVLSEDEINDLGTRMEELKTQLKQQTKSAGA